MVYKRKSVSKMAAAAAAAAWVHEMEGADTNPFAAVDAVVLAVHKVIPDKAPASAAAAAREEGASDYLCTAIAAGVAAAAVGWEFEKIKKVSSAASKAFRDNKDELPADIAKEVAKAVREVSSRYPAVEAAAAAAYAAYLSKHPGSGASAGDAAGGAAGDAASDPTDGIIQRGAAIAAADAVACAAYLSKRPVTSSCGEPAQGAIGGGDGSGADGASRATPADAVQRGAAAAAADAAAYAVLLSKRPVASGSGAPAQGAVGGGDVGAADGAADGAARAPPADVVERGSNIAAPDAAAYAVHLSKRPVTSGSGVPAHTATGGGTGGATASAGAPAGGIVKDGAAIAAANAAGEAAKAKRDPDRLSYAATAAARAATFRGASSRSVFKAAVTAATPTPANTTPANTPAPAHVQEVAEHVAVAITAASYADKEVEHALGACGKEILEMIPTSHELISSKLQTIVALDTFLAAFLLFSLTGRKQAEEDSADSGEVVQTILQAYSFGVCLAATISAGLFLVVTGGTYALTKNDLIVPTVLSTLGFGLLLVTVADAIYLELGEGVYYDDDHAPLFWTTVILGFLLQVGTIIYGVFSALLGSKYKWHFTSKGWPKGRRV